MIEGPEMEDVQPTRSVLAKAAAARAEMTMKDFILPVEF